jgi:serine/threonine protein kinase
MDFAEGGELTLLLKEKGTLSEEESKKIFKQIYEAVCYIHSQNIIHRDLKPNNILFLDKERTQIVIIDFGISGMANGNQREKIKAGTTSFLPPEMASGEEFSSSPKLDIWAMGIILYLMVEGCYPFDGKNTKEIIISILRSKLEFNKKIKISTPLKNLIGGMLEKNYRFRIDDNSELFNKWFDYTGPPIKRKKTLDEKNIKKKCENTFNYLTPTKSTSLKRLPTHSYNNYMKNQKQTNLMSKFKESANNNNNNINNIKVNANSPMPLKNFERKHSQLLPLIDNKNKNHMGINNEINAFRKQHRKSVEPKEPSTSSFQLNKNDSGNFEKKEDNKVELINNVDEENKEINHLYKSKLSSCKQVRLKKFI